MDIERPFQTVETASPNEEAFWVYLDEDLFTNIPNVRGNDGWPIFDVTLYKDWRFADNNKKSESAYGNYIYKDKKKVDKQVWGFFWVKVKTDAEIATPFYTGTITQDYQWPAVLNWIQFHKDYGAPMSQNTVDGSGRQALVIIPRWLVRRGYTHSQSLQTTIEIRRYLSHRPFPEALTESDEPIETEVSWDLVGSHGSTGRCLHPEVLVPSQGGAYALVDSAGNPSASGGSFQTGQQYFPKTNHKVWQDFTINIITESGNQFVREERKYIARSMPKPSIIT